MTKVKHMKTKIASISICIVLTSMVFMGLVGTVGATPPSTPLQPNGVSDGSHHVTYLFSVRAVYAQDSHEVLYNFSWDDGSYTLVGPFASGTGPVEASHEWTTTGVKQVRVQAKDNTTSELSGWSEPLNVSIVNLETPRMPEAVSDEAAIGELVEFQVSSVQAPFGHDVYYQFDWNDSFATNWIGPYPSGYLYPIEASHNWDELGVYSVRVKAKDDITDEESDWSEPFDITVGKEGPQFDIVGCTGGFGLTIFIQNMLSPSKYVDYTVDVAGGILTGFHVHRYYEGTVYVESGTTATISVPSFFSLGRTKIYVTAECGGEPVAEATYEARVLFFYVTQIVEQ